MTTKLFKKYGSIENSYREKFLNKIRQQGLDTGTWVATEKIHGANYSYWVGIEEDVWNCSRKNILDPEVSFYGNEMVAKYNPAIVETRKNLLAAEIISENDVIAVYGELFGGGFFGENMGRKKVQDHVDYCPGIEFMATDIIVYRNGDVDDFYILSFIGLTAYLHEDIPIAPVLAHGTLYDLLELEKDFSSKVPEAFGLTVPEGKYAQNEGWVLRPYDGERFMGETRCIIKGKNEKHSENKGKRKEGSKEKSEIVLTDEENTLYGDFSEYLNHPRLSAVASKMDDISWKIFHKMTGLFIQDAREDFEKDKEIRLRDSTEWPRVSKLVNKYAEEFVREYLTVKG